MESNSKQVSANQPAQRSSITITNISDIFNASGYALKKLGDLIQTMDENIDPENISRNSHWEHESIVNFATIVGNFNDELSELTSNLKNKINNRLKDDHSDEIPISITEERNLINS